MSVLPVRTFDRRSVPGPTILPAPEGVVPSPRRAGSAPAGPRPGRPRRAFRAWPLLLADVLAIILAGILAGRVVGAQAPLAAAVWLPLVSMAGGYEPRALRSRLHALRWVAGAGSGLVAVGVGLAALREPAASRDALFVCLVTVAISVVLRTQLGVGAGLVSARARKGVRVVVAGRRRDVLNVISELRRARGHDVRVVAACLPDNADETGLDLPVTRGFDTLTALVSASSADAVIAVPGKRLDIATLRRLRWDLEGAGASLLVAPGLVDVAGTRTRLSSVGTMPLVHVRRADLAGPRRHVKECWERGFSLVALILLVPVLAVLAVAIRLESSGPSLFRQTRVGRNGRTFTMYKLRTMTEHAEAELIDLQCLNEAGAVLFKVREDPRVTPIGRLLRRYSLDELPQLVNVVLGHMALIGPRPPLPREVALYDDATWRRLLVKPGLTGLWQVSGRSDLPWDESVRLDLEYVDNWSLGLDLSIASRTLGAIVSHRGAY